MKDLAEICLVHATVCAVVVLIAFWTTSPVLAVLPDEVLKDSVLEARARALSQELRCVVCQNQSIDDSNAPLARDLRIIVRERLVAGDSDEQAIGYLVARYGNFVLLRPPFQSNTILLWFGPLLLLIIAAGGFGAYLRRRPAVEAGNSRELTVAERKQFESLLQEEASK